MFISANSNASSNMNNSSLSSNLCSNLSSNLSSTNHLNSFGQDYGNQTAMANGLSSHHHFSSHYSHPQSSIYSSSNFHSQSFAEQQNQFSLNRYQNHPGLHSSFASNPFHLNLPKSSFEHSIANSGTLAGQTLMPNDSCNSSGSSSSPNSSASSTSSSSPDSKFNFLHAPQSNYLSNYLNSNSAFSSQNSIQHQLQSNNNASNLHHSSLQHAYSSFNQTRDSKSFCNQFNNTLIAYDDDDLKDDEDDEISMSHFDMKAMIQYSSSGNEPLPGKFLNCFVYLILKKRIYFTQFEQLD